MTPLEQEQTDKQIEREAYKRNFYLEQDARIDAGDLRYMPRWYPGGYNGQPNLTSDKMIEFLKTQIERNKK